MGSFNGRPAWSVFARLYTLSALLLVSLLTGSVRGLTDNPKKNINIVYATSATTPDMVIRSAWSAVASASYATRDRMHLHFVYMDTPGTPDCFEPFREYVTVHLYEDPFGPLPIKPKVWGYGTGGSKAAYVSKLENPANYWRFYIPDLVKDQNMILYIDGDTLIMNDIAWVWDDIDRDLKKSGTKKHPPYAVAAGLQDVKACHYGKMIETKDERVADLKIRGKEPCLTGGVLFINIKHWYDQDIKGKSEEIIRSNREKKLYALGSMPPLMILLYNNYLKLPEKVVFDNKKHECCKQYTRGEYTIMHPVKKVMHRAAWQIDLLSIPWKKAKLPSWLPFKKRSLLADNNMIDGKTMPAMNERDEEEVDLL